jgi:hypothetical protein
MVRTSELVVPIRSAARVEVAMSTPLWLGQVITIAVNHHEVARRALAAWERMTEIGFDVPDSVLAPDGLQLVTFGYTRVSDDEKAIPVPRTVPEHAAARLHTLEIQPLVARP